MKILAVDTDQAALEQTIALLRAICPEDEITGFSNPMLAVKYGINQSPEVLFTEISMRGVDGLTLVRLLREHHPAMKAVFVSETDVYGVDAMRTRADGYLLKPISGEMIRRMIPWEKWRREAVRTAEA